VERNGMTESTPSISAAAISAINTSMPDALRFSGAVRMAQVLRMSPIMASARQPAVLDERRAERIQRPVELQVASARPLQPEVDRFATIPSLEAGIDLEHEDPDPVVVIRIPP